MPNSLLIPSPLGDLIAIADEDHLLVLSFADSEWLDQKLLPLLGGVRGGTTSIPHPTSPTRGGVNHLIPRDDGSSKVLAQTVQELSEYFAWTRENFSIPLAPVGTEFQRKAWEALKQIPYGETRSYQAEATMIGNPKAVRAIGGANNKNPIVIIIPCHRVIGKSGELVWYGGGMERKIWLLEHEKLYR